jgi:DNA-binding response OmpR family regulator
LHVLAIEDDVATVDRVEEALRGLGYRTFDIAFSAAEALDSARRRCPDLITADVRLVDGSGIDAVLEICSDNPIPLVFITAARPEHITATIPEAIIVAKPFEIDRIKSAVARAVKAPFSSPTAR